MPVRVECSVAACLGLFACLLSSDSVSAQFVDKTEALGLKLGGGAACWADFDNDGWTDLCSGGVWRNLEGEGFEKVADVPGSCVAADFDNDGDADLFSWSSLKLLRNDDGQFRPVELPELPACVSRGACWADLNGDGYVDLFVGGYEDWGKGITYPYLILINERGKAFRLEHQQSKFRARGVTACDFDQDGDVDVYVSNYRLQPNLLWVNDGKGKLTEAAAERGVVATSAGFGGGHSIGACWGDFDNDGLMDLFAGNFAHRDSRGNQPQSRFLRNKGEAAGHTFEDRGTCGVFYQESYASPAAGDYDNDGNLDLFFTTVYGTASFGRPNNAVLFRGDGKFGMTDVTEATGLPKLPPTYQAAWADYDNDGDLDLITAGKLFENQTRGRSWLRARLVGDGAAVNRSAVGAQVRVELGDQRLTRHVEAGTGEGNQNDLTLHFGLGDHEQPLKLEILWPDGKRQSLDEVPPNQTLVVEYAP